ncbi:MAG: F0F1 ATP synthase subunit A [Chloroflexia bacterium]|nr:F0F1 ATP synthase subunit A [Chloroflexia bacterium]MDQ3514601.1 F0F1 ATP synthase subunit A [Chloroflexota bacterium]
MEVHVELAAETLFNLGPIPITNSMLTMFIVMSVILLVGWLIARSAKVIPGRTQGAFEGIVEFLLSLVEATAGKRAGRRIFPLVGGLFIFIIVANYSGLLPGVGTIGYYHTEEAQAEEGVQQESEELEVPDISEGEETADQPEGAANEGEETGAQSDGEAVAATEEHAEEEAHQVLVPYFRAPNADLNMTLALALLTFTVVQFAGIASHGVGGRLKHMADPPFLFPIEVVSEFSRIISLSARLFGNVFAGEVLLAVMFAMAAAIRVAVIPFVFPVIFLGLELLFGAIQALVFALLTLIYITLATAGGHDDHGAHDAETHTEGVQGLGNVPAGAAD